MTAAPTELDADTKARLVDEVERLVRMGVDRMKARRLVWDDYLDELAAYAAPASDTKPSPPQPPEIPEPEPPVVVPAMVTAVAQSKPTEPFFTPERMQRNRSELAKVKRIVGLRK